MSRTTSHIVFGLLTTSVLLLAAPALAMKVPVLGSLLARTDSAPGLISGSGQVYGSAVDSEGNIYIASVFNGTVDFDPSGGTDNIASGGTTNAFLSKYSADGTYQWTKTWGGATEVRAYGITIDSVDNIFVMGLFRDTPDFDPGAGTASVTAVNGLDVYVSKFDSDGNFLWVRGWGTTGTDNLLWDMKTDDANNIYAASYFSGTIDFDGGVGTTNATSAGNTDAYLIKYDADGIFQWVKTWGGTDVDTSYALDIADDGGIYTTGIFGSTADFDPSVGTNNVTSAGSYDPYLLKLDSDGIFQWVKTWGGTGFDSGNLIDRDSDGNVYVEGQFNGTADLDPGAGTTNVTSNGGGDIFISQLTSDGTFQWGKAWGGTASEITSSLKIFAEEVVVSGYFTGTVDFDPSGSTNSKVSNGGRDVYMSTLGTDGTYYRTDTFGGTLDDWVDTTGTTRNVNPDLNKLLFHGFYKSAPADFDPSGAQVQYSSNGTSEYLISFDLIEPEITQSSPSKTDLDEGASDSLTYTFVLTTPPDDDVVFTVTLDDQLLASPATLTFSSSTWATPQTVTVSPVEDDDVEGTHLGEITNTVASNDAQYDGMTLDSLEVTIHDDDGGGGGGGGGSRPRAVEVITEHAITTPQPALPAVQNNAELIAQIQTKIAELKQQLIELLTQKLKELQAQLAAMQS